MKKLLLLVLILLSVVLGYTFSDYRPFAKDTKESAATTIKKPILRIGLVSDSHNENDLLVKALRQAQGKGINLVIGIGDYTNLGREEELIAAKKVFDDSRLNYYVIPGDRDGWQSRSKGEENAGNFKKVFGQPNHQLTREGVQFVLLDNSDIYLGLNAESLKLITDLENSKLTFVFAHKTPFHPDSKHVMGENSAYVANQAKEFLSLLTKGKVDGFFAGDLHFFAQYQDPTNTVKITTVGAVAASRNFQGPRFAILTVFNDYSWEVEDVEIR